MTNTHKRIISAIVMASIVVAAIYFGMYPSLALVGIVGYLVVDEILINFLKVEKNSISRTGYLCFYLGAYLYSNFLVSNFLIINISNLLGLIINLLFLLYLFITPMKSKSIVNFLRKYRLITVLIYLICILNLSSIIHFPDWKTYLAMMAILTFSVDTAAWFWGKNYGKRKLWESVSPNKTKEGFIGGIISASTLTYILWKHYLDDSGLLLFIGLVILACCAQLGDLVQSKLKRQFEIKDSSNFIPGHGGVYDRVDSIVFVAPLFIVLIKILG